MHKAKTMTSLIISLSAALVFLIFILTYRILEWFYIEIPGAINVSTQIGLTVISISFAIISFFFANEEVFFQQTLALGIANLVLLGLLIVNFVTSVDDDHPFVSVICHAAIFLTYLILGFIRVQNDALFIHQDWLMPMFAVPLGILLVLGFLTFIVIIGVEGGSGGYGGGGCSNPRMRNR